MASEVSTYIATIHATSKGHESLYKSSGLLMGRRKWIMLVFADTRIPAPTITQLFTEVRRERRAFISDAILARELRELEREGLIRIAR